MVRAARLLPETDPPGHARRIGPRVPAIAVAALAVTALALLPLGFVLRELVATGWTTASALIFRPRAGELLLNTLLLVILAGSVSGLLGTALAWLVERSDLPARWLWDGLAVAPLAVPAFVHSYAWVSVVPGLHGLGAGVLVATLAYFPFFYLPVAAALRRLDPELEDAAAALGHPPLRVFTRVVLPQLRIALCGGALIVSLHLLAEYGLFAMIRFDTFTTAIVAQFQAGFNSAAANMLAVPLVVLCLGLLALEARARGRARYARVGSGAARAAGRRRLGRATLPCLLLCAAAAALSVGVPFITLARWLAAGGFAVWASPALLAALGQSLGYALAGGALAVLAAVPMAWLSVRAPGRLQRGLEACNYIVGSLPGVVVALALVTITVRVAHPLYQSVATVLFAYAVIFLPRALVSLRAAIAQAPLELEQAARGLGRTPTAALVTVTLRLAAPGAAAGMALAALGILNELPATQMLAPNGTRTLAMGFWALSGELDYAGAAPYALLMVLLSLPLVVVLRLQSRRSSGR